MNLPSLGGLPHLFLILFLGSLRLSAKAEEVSLNTHHYLLLGICFFLFYPLMFVLSKHIPMAWAFILSLATIALFILSFLKKITTTEFALSEGIVFLGVFLLLFTLAVLISRMMGLFFVLGGLILIATFMWMAMRTKAVPAIEAIPSEEVGIDESHNAGLAELLAGLKPEPAAKPGAGGVSVLEGVKGFCTFCGQDIAAGYEFCPSCGRGVTKSITCHECGRELCAECGKKFRFCSECGASLEPEPDTKGRKNQKNS